MIVRWIQMANGRWHAWPQGGRSTSCGTVNAENLKQRPAKRVASMLPDGADRCGTCAKRVGLAAPNPALPDTVAAAWQGVIARRLVQQHLRAAVNQKLAGRYASLLAQVGLPGDSTALRVFTLTWPVLFHVKHVGGRARVAGLSAALDAIPDGAALARVADGVAAWQELVGGHAVLSRERFAADRVITTILAAKDPRAYVRLVREHEPEVKFFAALWHPDRYARYEKRPDARGLMRGSPAYWAQTSDQLIVVSDE